MSWVKIKQKIKFRDQILIKLGTYLKEIKSFRATVKLHKRSGAELHFSYQILQYERSLGPFPFFLGREIILAQRKIQGKERASPAFGPSKPNRNTRDLSSQVHVINPKSKAKPFTKNPIKIALSKS